MFYSIKGKKLLNFYNPIHREDVPVTQALYMGAHKLCSSEWNRLGLQVNPDIFLFGLFLSFGKNIDLNLL